MSKLDFDITNKSESIFDDFIGKTQAWINFHVWKKLKTAVTSINGQVPDEDGNISIEVSGGEYTIVKLDPIEAAGPVNYVLQNSKGEQCGLSIPIYENKQLKLVAYNDETHSLELDYVFENGDTTHVSVPLEDLESIYQTGDYILIKEQADGTWLVQVVSTNVERALTGKVDLPKYENEAYEAVVIAPLTSAFLSQNGNPVNVNGEPFNEESNPAKTGTDYLGFQKMSNGVFTYDIFEATSSNIGQIMKACFGMVKNSQKTVR